MSILPKCAVVLLSLFLTSLASAQMTFTTIDVPGAAFTGLLGINTMGDTVGYYGESSDGPYHDYQTVALGINDGGVIVGWYNPGSSHYYAFAFLRGRYVSFNYPGAQGTFANGINASGQIVGQYTLDYNTYHGFVTSPITPANFEETSAR